MTIRAGVVGHPVAHSLSPLIHSAWIEATGIDADYGLFDIAPENFAAFVASHRGGGGLRGVNVTVPHKEAALACATQAHPTARRAGAANMLLFEPDGSVVSFVPEATLIGQGRLVSDLTFVPWASFVEGFSHSLLI